MTVIERSLLTAGALLLFLGVGYLVRALWRRHVLRRAGMRTGDGVGRSGEPTLMHFKTEGCAPCRTQEIVIRELQAILAAQGQTIRITSHDAVDETELARTLRVVTVPTTVLFAGDGRMVAWNPGLTGTRALLDQIRPLLDLRSPEVDEHLPAQQSLHGQVAEVDDLRASDRLRG